MNLFRNDKRKKMLFMLVTAIVVLTSCFTGMTQIVKAAEQYTVKLIYPFDNWECKDATVYYTYMKDGNICTESCKYSDDLYTDRYTKYLYVDTNSAITIKWENKNGKNYEVTTPVITSDVQYCIGNDGIRITTEDVCEMLFLCCFDDLTGINLRDFFDLTDYGSTSTSSKTYGNYTVTITKGLKDSSSEETNGVSYTFTGLSIKNQLSTVNIAVDLNATYASNLSNTLTIPNVLNNKGTEYQVCDIGKISAGENLENVIIPENIINIASRAFSAAKSLNKVTFKAPENISYIGDYAFSETKLKEIDLTGLLRQSHGYNVLSDNVFYACKELGKVSYKINENKSQDSIYVPMATFRSCTSLSEFDYGQLANLYFGNYSFQEANFKSLDFNADTYIGKHAFEKNYNLENLVFKKNVTIENNGFSQAMVNEPATVVFNASGSLGNSAFAGCNALNVINFNSKKQSLYTTVITPTAVPSLEEDTQTSSATNAPTSVPTVEPTLIPEQYKGDVITIYGKALNGTKIESINIDTDSMYLHTGCLDGMKALSEVCLGGTNLTMLGGAFDGNDNLSDKDIVINSTNVIFADDLSDHCYQTADKAQDDVPNSSKIYAGAFSSTNAKNIIFTKNVEVVGGEYASQCYYTDNYQSMRFYNPTVRFIVGNTSKGTLQNAYVLGQEETSIYCGFNSFFKIKRPNGKDPLSVYAYEYGEGYKYPQNLAKLSIGLGSVYTSVDGKNYTDENLDSQENLYYTNNFGLLSFKLYAKNNKENIQYKPIELEMTASYQGVGNNKVIAGTKLDEDKIIVNMQYANSTSITNGNSYNVKNMICQGFVEEGNLSYAGDKGFTYTTTFPNGQFPTEEDEAQIIVMSGNKKVTINLEIVGKDVESCDITLSKDLLEGMTLKKSDFIVKNLKYNDKDTCDADTVGDKYKTLDDFDNVEVYLCDTDGNEQKPLIFEGETENPTRIESEKAYLFKVRLNGEGMHSEFVKNSEGKKTFFATEKKLAKLVVEDVKQENSSRVEGADINLNDFKIIPYYNNGLVAEDIVIDMNKVTLNQDTYKIGNNEITFTYEGVNGTIKINNVPEKQIQSLTYALNPEVQTLPEGSAIPLEKCGLKATYNNGKTEALSAEELALCKVSGDIVAGANNAIEILYTYKGKEVKTTINVLGTEKKIIKISAILAKDAEKEVSQSTPLTVDFYYGDIIIPSDLCVTAYYNNGLEQIDGLSTDKYTFIGDTVLNGRVTTIKLALVEDPSVTCEIDITAKEPTLTSLRLLYDGIDTPITMKVDEKIDTKKITVIAIYNEKTRDEQLRQRRLDVDEYEILYNGTTDDTDWFSINRSGKLSVVKNNIFSNEIIVNGVEVKQTVTPAPTAEAEVTATPVPTEEAGVTATPMPKTFEYKSNNKKIKLVKSSAKTTYKVYTNKKITFTAKLANDEVYYQIVKKGSKYNSKKWKQLKSSVVIKSDMSACVYFKYTDGKKSVIKKTNGFVFDKTAPKISVSKTAKLSVKDNGSGISKITDNGKKIKNGKKLRKGKHKIIAQDKAGNKKVANVTVK